MDEKSNEWRARFISITGMQTVKDTELTVGDITYDQWRLANVDAYMADYEKKLEAVKV